MTEAQKAIKCCIEALGYLNKTKPTDNQLWLAIAALKQAESYANDAYFFKTGERFEEGKGA